MEGIRNTLGASVEHDEVGTRMCSCQPAVSTQTDKLHSRRQI